MYHYTIHFNGITLISIKKKIKIWVNQTYLLTIVQKKILTKCIYQFSSLHFNQ